MDIFQWDYWGYLSALALLAWIPITLVLFSHERPTRAATHAMVWGMMWLPEGASFDLPGLPPLSKYSISALCALLGLWWKAPARLRAARIGRGYDWILWVMLAGQIGTVLTNGDPLHYGTWKSLDLPGFKPYDGLSTCVRVVISVGVPTWLGRSLLRSKRDLIDVLEILVVAGLVYSLPIFWELRMSPMLHENIYGYAPRTDWLQNMRQGGYRATVFVGHGLVVGFLIFLSTAAAVTLHKAGKRSVFGVPMWLVVVYLFVTLVLCKAAAALIYGAVAFMAIRYLSVKAHMRVLAVLAVLVVSYPISRMLEVFPADSMLSAAGLLGPERVQSLQFRFDNEDILLLKGAERLWFGWGGFNRERVYDPETAKDLVIQDGHWISVFGTLGLVGFCCFFALLVVPVVQAALEIKRLRDRSERVLIAGFGFIVVICSVNMLPNMQLPYLQFFFAAGLSVLAKELPRQAAASAKQAAAKQAEIAAAAAAAVMPVVPEFVAPAPPRHAPHVGHGIAGLQKTG
jgi:hypothetical protein